MQLSQGGVDDRLAGIAAATRQGPLATMGAQPGGPQGQQHRRIAAITGLDQHDGDGRLLQTGRRRFRRADKVGTADRNHLPRMGREWMRHANGLHEPGGRRTRHPAPAFVERAPVPTLPKDIA